MITINLIYCDRNWLQCLWEFVCICVCVCVCVCVSGCTYRFILIIFYLSYSIWSLIYFHISFHFHFDNFILQIYFIVISFETGKKMKENEWNYYFFNVESVLSFFFSSASFASIISIYISLLFSLSKIYDSGLMIIFSIYIDMCVCVCLYAYVYVFVYTYILFIN